MSNITYIVNRLTMKATLKFVNNEVFKMFLFNKKTKNIIKYAWGFFAVLITLTMIIAYSGFATLAQPQPKEQIEIPEEVRQQLKLQKEGGNFEGDEPTATEQELLRAIEAGEIDINPEDSTEQNSGEDTTGEASQEDNEQEKPPEQTAPPSQELKLEV